MTTIKYKVIAEYPDMILEVGQIVEQYPNGRAYVTSETKANLADYPHLFQEVKESTGRVLGDYDIWYELCENCGHDTGKVSKANNRCWKCGQGIKRDYSDRALKKDKL